jgi:hypothetical protein
MINESVKKVLAHKSDYYMELFERQSQSRKQLLKALVCEGENIFSLEYIIDELFVTLLHYSRHPVRSNVALFQDCRQIQHRRLAQRTQFP